mmetsp:Transcript_13699/g.43277  ORF Transcript_13699/g.43277 Transcript_13699/m.43277 type:complete len:270 (-) Transcript_13699:12-821(-)
MREIEELGGSAVGIKIFVLGGGGVGDDAVHAGRGGRLETDEGVLDDNAARRRQAETLSGERVDHGIGFLFGDVVAGDNNVQLREPLRADHGVDDLLEAASSAGRADAHREAPRRDRLVHQTQDSRPRDCFLHEVLVHLRLVRLEVVDQGVALRLARGSRPIRRLGPPPDRLREVVLHLRFPPAHGVLELVVVLHRPLHRLAVDPQPILGKRFVVRAAMQLFRFDQDAVAVEQQRRLERPRYRRRPVQHRRLRRHQSLRHAERREHHPTE